MIDAYRTAIAEDEAAEHQEAMAAREAEQAEPSGMATEAAGQAEPEGEVLRWGSRLAEIEKLRVLVGGEERYHLRCGENVSFEITVDSRRELDDFVFGLAISTPRGHECWGTNTDLAGYVPERSCPPGAPV